MISFGAPNAYPYAVNKNTDSYNPRPNMDMAALELTGDYNCIVFDNKERLVQAILERAAQRLTGKRDASVFDDYWKLENLIAAFERKRGEETSHAPHHLD